MPTETMPPSSFGFLTPRLLARGVTNIARFRAYCAARTHGCTNTARKHGHVKGMEDAAGGGHKVHARLCERNELGCARRTAAPQAKASVFDCMAANAQKAVPLLLTCSWLATRTRSSQFEDLQIWIL